MKPRSHYLRYPIGETGWALMKILLNIAGWFLYFAQWQKSRYPCQFTLNSASCQGSLYQGASNAHPLLNDSKATSPDRGLTTPVMHTQDTLPCAGTSLHPHSPHNFSPKSWEVFDSFGAKTFCWSFRKLSDLLYLETLASINCSFDFLPSTANLFMSVTSCHSWRSVYFHPHPVYSTDTEAVMSVDAHHLMFTPCGRGPMPRANNESKCDCSGSPHICGPALPHNHQFPSKRLFLNGFDAKYSLPDYYSCCAVVTQWITVDFFAFWFSVTFCAHIVRTK